MGSWVEDCKRAIGSASMLLFQRRHHSRAQVYTFTDFEIRKDSQGRTDQHCLLYNSGEVEDVMRLSVDRYVDSPNPEHPVQGGTHARCQHLHQPANGQLAAGAVNDVQE